MEKYFEGIGRRKTSTARVRIYKGDKASTINGVPAVDYLKEMNKSELYIIRPLTVVGLEKQYYFTAKVQGGGISGQRDAVKLGLARALVSMDESLRVVMRQHGLLTRDARVKERKKPGLKRARKAPTYTKR